MRQKNHHPIRFEDTVAREKDLVPSFRGRGNPGKLGLDMGGQNR